MNKKTFSLIAPAIIGFACLVFWKIYLSDTTLYPSTSDKIQLIDANDRSIQNKAGNPAISNYPEALTKSEQQQITLFKSMKTMLDKASGGRGVGVFVVPDTDPYSAESMRRMINSVQDISSEVIKNFQNAGGQDGIRLNSAENLSSDKSLFVDPASITGTTLESASSTGYTKAGTYLESPSGIKSPELKALLATKNNRNGWTGLTRVFDNVPGLGRVTLDELDIASGRAVIRIPQSAINCYVAGNPATLSRMQDSAGNGFASLRWIEGNARLMELKVNRNDQNSMRALMDLAISLANRARK